MAGKEIARAVLLLSVLLLIKANPTYDCCPAGKIPVCPNHDPKMAILLPHPMTCEWYFECSNGIAYCMPCPAGEYFNPKLKVCDYPVNSGCVNGNELETRTGTTSCTGIASGDDTDSKPDTEQDTKITSRKENGVGSICPTATAPACPAQDPKMAVLLPHPTSCEWYYECSNGIPYCMPCPAGEYFNPKLKVCDYPEHAGCAIVNGDDDTIDKTVDTHVDKSVCPATTAPACPAQDPKMAILLPHPTSCEWYYECSNGIPYCMPCPVGEYFNPKLSVCDYPDHAGCTVGSNKLARTGTVTAIETDAGTVAETDTVTDTEIKSVCPATETPKCPAHDPSMAVLLSHPTSCSWYFECSNGIPYCMPCPAGEYFNDELKVCDYAEHSGCIVAS